SPPFFGEMLHDWLKERTKYYEEVLTDYRAKCSRLQEFKKKMQRQNNRVQSDLFCEALPVAKKWEYLEAEWKLSDHGCKQNQIPSSSKKKKLVKNDIEYLPLNTLSDKFLKDILADKKVIDWELGYAMTIHTSQEMTLKSLQHVWEKLIGYMGQNKEKGCEFDLTVDYILILNHIQEERCASCFIEMKFECDQPGDILQWTRRNHSSTWIGHNSTTFISNIENNACLNNNWFYGRKYNNDKLQIYIPEIVIDKEDAFVRTTLCVKDLNGSGVSKTEKAKSYNIATSNLSTLNVNSDNSSISSIERNTHSKA
ncbi:24376_t:CDS:2, partial [Gigaspora rosea]